MNNKKGEGADEFLMIDELGMMAVVRQRCWEGTDDGDGVAATCGRVWTTAYGCPPITRALAAQPPAAATMVPHGRDSLLQRGETAVNDCSLVNRALKAQSFGGDNSPSWTKSVGSLGSGDTVSSPASDHASCDNRGTKRGVTPAQVQSQGQPAGRKLGGDYAARQQIAATGSTYSAQDPLPVSSTQSSLFQSGALLVGWAHSS